MIKLVRLRIICKLLAVFLSFLVLLAGILALWFSPAIQARVRIAAPEGSSIVGFTPDGQRLVTCNLDEDRSLVARFWDVTTGNEWMRSASINNPEGTESLNLGPEFKVPGILVENYKMEFENPATGESEPVFRLQSAGSALVPLYFSPDGRNTILPISDLPKPWRDMISELDLPDKRRGDAVVLSDGRILISGAPRGCSTVWDSKTGKKLVEFTDSGGWWPGNPCISSDGRLLVTRRTLRGKGPGGSELTIWDLSTGKETTIPNSLVDVDHDAMQTILPDNKTVVTGCFDSKQWWCVKLWDLDSGRERASFPVAAFFFNKDPQVRPDGKTFAVTKQKTVDWGPWFDWIDDFLDKQSWIPKERPPLEWTQYDLETGRSLGALPSEKYKQTFFSPDSKTLAVKYLPHGTIQLLDAPPKPTRRTLIDVFAISAMVMVAAGWGHHFWKKRKGREVTIPEARKMMSSI